MAGNGLSEVVCVVLCCCRRRVVARLAVGVVARDAREPWQRERERELARRVERAVVRPAQQHIEPHVRLADPRRVAGNVSQWLKTAERQKMKRDKSKDIRDVPTKTRGPLKRTNAPR